MNRFRLLYAVVFGLFVTFATGAFAQAGMIHTGDSVRVKSVGPFTAKVYAIRHDMKEKPAQKSRQAVIDADVDKKFTWTMLRDVDSPKIQKALKDAFALNGFGDQARIGQFVGAFNKDEVKEKSAVVITYNAAAKTTTIWVQNGGSATVAGQDFMKAAWSIWFGKIDQPAMGDQLISKL
ncbi:MAG: chalcone isomerase family protein [Labilithrix sp.]|nr:chalcone isomerase family protein [Labilithrix sp.]